MRIKINKKLILTYLNLGIISFCLTGCKIKDTSITNPMPTEIITSNNDDNVEIIWHIPDGYRLVNRDGQPQFVKVVKDRSISTKELSYSLPKGYELVTINGQKKGIKLLDDGTIETIIPHIIAPVGYHVEFINGRLMAAKEIEINVLSYLNVTSDDYELPEGYEIAYLDGNFVGVKITNDEEKTLVKSN